MQSEPAPGAFAFSVAPGPSSTLELPVTVIPAAALEHLTPIVVIPSKAAGRAEEVAGIAHPSLRMARTHTLACTRPRHPHHTPSLAASTNKFVLSGTKDVDPPFQFGPAFHE